MTIADYIHEFIDPGFARAGYDHCRAEFTRRTPAPMLVWMWDVLLGLLVRMTGAQRVLEFGTCLGYSAVWLADALRETGGHLTSVELDHGLVVSARAYLQQAGLTEWAESRRGGCWADCQNPGRTV